MAIIINNQLRMFLNKRVYKLVIFLTQVSMVYFLINTTLAMLLYPNYTFTKQFLSELGMGPTSFLFNSSLIITGILYFPFYLIMGILIQKDRLDNKYINIAMVFGPLASIFLIFIGIFDMSEENFVIHNIFAISFFIINVLVIACVSYGLMELKWSNRLKGKLSISPYFCIFMVFLLTWYLVHINWRPFIQKCLIYTLIGHIFHFSLKMKRYVNSYTT